ncbi:MAG TPA: LexA family transcriptional regulator [Chitinophagaceae bacterium]|nr:LexA family transcriptional regulator [Chitinophagaceae bacterium]
MKNTPNLKEIRQLHNLTQEEFALALGITRELVNKMEKGKCGVSKGTAALLQQFVQERQRENFSPEVVEIGSPHPSPQKVTFPYVEQRREKKQEKAPVQVPLVAQKVQAGYAKGYEHVDYLDALEKYSLPPGVNGTGAVWSYFEVDGDSMEPTFFPGDIVLASMLPHEDWDDIKNFGVYVILAGDHLVLKRVYRKSPDMWVLISDNEEQYPQQLLSVHTIKQVWTFRRHIRTKVAPPREFKIIA